MKIQTVLMIIISFLGGALAYAMDWQREQDEKLSNLDKMIEKQSLILDQQIMINMQIKERGFIVTPTVNDAYVKDKKP